MDHREPLYGWNYQIVDVTTDQTRNRFRHIGEALQFLRYMGYGFNLYEWNPDLERWDYKAWKEMEG